MKLKAAVILSIVCFAIMPIDKLIEENIGLAQYTTLQIGGPARYFAEAKSADQVAAALAFAVERRLPVFVLGGGSNVLIADRGFPGLVLRVVIKGLTWEDAGDQIKATAGAGEGWDGFVEHCVARDLAGVECLSGIPGFVGGTPVQNVGAYGQEVSQTIVSVKVFDRRPREITELSNAECEFGYRTSIFNTSAHERYIVLAVTFALKKGGRPAIGYPDLQSHFGGRATPPSLREVREAVRAIRARKGMVIVPDDPDCRSAGSFFKNPIVTLERLSRIEAAAKHSGLLSVAEQVPSFPAGRDQAKIPAAWLIERAGFQKGFVRGRAGISSRHTLAMINRGGATAAEVMDLVREIRQRVEEKFGLSLQPEPVLVGFELKY